MNSRMTCYNFDGPELTDCARLTRLTLIGRRCTNRWGASGTPVAEVPPLVVLIGSLTTQKTCPLSEETSSRTNNCKKRQRGILNHAAQSVKYIYIYLRHHSPAWPGTPVTCVTLCQRSNLNINRLTAAFTVTAQVVTTGTAEAWRCHGNQFGLWWEHGPDVNQKSLNTFQKPGLIQEQTC